MICIKHENKNEETTPQWMRFVNFQACNNPSCVDIPLNAIIQSKILIN